jgi:hypothetical protein
VKQDHVQPIRIRRRQALAALAVPLAAAALPAIANAAPLAGPASAGGRNAGTPAFLYVNLNTASTNQVAGFARNSDGSLTPLAGSPFTVGGAGSGVGLGSQGAIQSALGGRLLLVADAGSNQISALKVQANGALTPVPGSPFGSGGNSPVSIAIRGSLVFVANQGNGGSNYTGFALNTSGALTPLAGSTFALPDGSGVGDVLVDNAGKHLVGARVATSLIDSFVIGAGGVLTPAPGYPIASQSPGPLGSTFKGSGTPRLFVSNAHAGALLGTVSAYTVAANGTLTPLPGSPYADFQTAPCWVALSPDGSYLFTANAGSGSISSYAIASSGALTFASTTSLKGAPSLGTFDLRLDPSGQFLYQLDGAANEISVLAVSGGTMTELPFSPVALPATGGAPFGLVVV